MKEIGPEHSMSYRQEVLVRLFNYVKSADSCFLVGAGSMGKTRLMDFLMRPEVQQEYLREKADKTIFIRMDMNRISELTEWGFYELALTTTLQTAIYNPELQGMALENIKGQLLPLLSTPNALKALRLLEFTINSICIREGFNLCFLFDEFDSAYETLPKEVFSHLRAIRDTNKNCMGYALFLRNLPECLRPPDENESFYELLSANMIGMGPYSELDTDEMVRQLEARKNFPLRFDQTRNIIYQTSGGHPGLVRAMFGLYIKHSEQDKRLQDMGWVAAQEDVKEECRKIMESLSPNEKLGLTSFVQGHPETITKQIEKLLLAKGLLRETETDLQIFSPALEYYLSYSAAEQNKNPST
jgi:hypothetical protein